MSQSDTFENPILVTTFRPIRARSHSPMSPSTKLLQSCYTQGTRKASDTDTPGIQSQYSVLPHPFQRRHSNLSRDEHRVKHLASRDFADAPVFDDSSAITLAENNKTQNTQIDASQKQEDGVRMMLHSDRRAREEIIKCDWERDQADESHELFEQRLVPCHLSTCRSELARDSPKMQRIRARSVSPEKRPRSRG